MENIINVVIIIIEHILSVLSQRFHIKLANTVQKGLLDFVKFCIIGVTNLIVMNLTCFFVLFLCDLFSLFENVSIFIANILGYILSVQWSFYWNNKLVFQVKYHYPKEKILALIKMYLAYAFTGIFLNNLLSWIWVYKLGLSKFISPLINSVIGVPINYVLNKYWAFRIK